MCVCVCVCGVCVQESEMRRLMREEEEDRMRDMKRREAEEDEQRRLMVLEEAKHNEQQRVAVLLEKQDEADEHMRRLAADREREQRLRKEKRALVKQARVRVSCGAPAFYLVPGPSSHAVCSRV